MSIIKLFFKGTILYLLCFSYFTANAAERVLAIPIPQVSSSNQSTQMIEKELPKSLDYLSPKIVGGTTAGRTEFPEFTQLFVDGLDGFIYAVCGATLLSSNKILTAAHCTFGITASRFYALPNFYSFNDNITFNDLIPVSTKKQHPNYQQSTQFNNDVSILTLSRNSNMPAAKIFAGDDQLVGYSATVIGTGVTSEGSTNPPATLRKVTIPIVSNAICKSSYGNSKITDKMLCAGLSSGGKDSCQGDSGGPLWVTFEGQKVQAGIVSWGNGCARPNFYGVYARTSALIEFIFQHAPNAQIVKEKSNSIVPILQLLLLDDENQNIAFDAVQADAGDSHTCATLASGTIVCWGSNSIGQLGNNSITNSSIPVPVSGISNATQVAAGDGHSCARLSNGQIKCWGYNASGLGNGSTTNSSTPVLVSGISNATQVAAGDGHSCARLSNGQIKCWGYNAFGQLGNGSTTSSSIPVLVSGISNASQVSTGRNVTCATLASGAIMCWGFNFNGQLGNNSTTNSSIPVLVNGISNATQVAVNYSHTCARLNTGQVKCWGYKYLGRLGNGENNFENSLIPVLVSNLSNATQVAVGPEHSCARLNTGQVKCWGYEYYGRLGNGEDNFFGSSDLPVLVNGLSNVTQITADGEHSCSLLTSKKIKCWGYNGFGQLGNGSTANSSIPVFVQE